MDSNDGQVYDTFCNVYDECYGGEVICNKIYVLETSDHFIYNDDIKIQKRNKQKQQQTDKHWSLYNPLT